MIGLSKSRAQSRHLSAVGHCYRCAGSAAILTVPCAARNLFGNNGHKPPTKGFEGEVLFETSSRRAGHARQIARSGTIFFSFAFSSSSCFSRCSPKAACPRTSSSN
jgi:hypothetical protein